MEKAIGNAGLAAVISIGLLVALPVIAWAAPVLLVGISIGGQSLAGMMAGETRSVVERYINGLAGQKVILNVDGQDVETTAGELGSHWSNTDAVDQVASQYAGDSLIRQYMVQKDLASMPVDLGLDTEVDFARIEEFVDTQCQAVTAQPQGATIIRKNGQFVITDSVAGKVVDATAMEVALNEALEGGLEEPIKVTVEVAEQQSAITTEAPATIQDMPGTYTTGFSSSGATRSTNPAVDAAKTNGHLLMPGEVSSGYECLQPFTTTNGYKTAMAYENSQVVDSIGGGVRQLATTLYNASLEAEVEIVQRQNHSMIVTYVKPSRDAAIAGTYKDIKTKSNYSTPIYVEGYTEGRKLAFTTYGKETRLENRKVEYVTETLGSTSPGEPQLIVDNALAPGAKVKVQSSHTGFRSGLWKAATVDGVEQERILLSKDTYNVSRAIYRVGPALPTGIPSDPNAVAPVETAPAETTPVTGVDGRPGVTQPAPTEAAPDPVLTDPALVQTDPALAEAVPDLVPVVTSVPEVAG